MRIKSNVRKKVCKSIFQCLLLLLFISGHLVAQTNWYVSQETAASDDNSGTYEAPFRTVQKAADVAVAGDTVFVREGVYRETVTPVNSGTSANPIVYMPFGDEEVTISGNEVISGWTKHKDNIYKAPMPADFFVNVVNMTDQIFVDQQMMNLARWPNNGFEISYPVKAIADKCISKSREGNITRATMMDEDLPEGDFTGAEIYFQPEIEGWSWLFCGTVTDVQGKEFSLETYSNAGNMTKYHDNSRYYFYNKMSLLDTAGEWFHERNKGELYLWLPENGTPDNHVIEAKKRVYGFNLSKKSYIVIKGFTFFACNITTDDESGGDGKGFNPDGTPRYPWRYDNIAESHHVVIDGVTCLYPSHSSDMSGHFFFQYGSHSGIVLSGEDHILQNSIIRYSFANAISLLGNRHKMYNNVITDINYNAGGYGAMGQSAALAYDCEFAYNTIRRTGRSGIRQGFRNSDPSNIVARIHHNIISDFMIQDHDGAGYYHSGDGGFLRVDHNIIYGGKGIMVCGIYPDWAKNYIYDHNVLYNTWSNFWFVKSHDGEGVTNFIAYNNTCVATNNNNFADDGLYAGPSNFYLFNSAGTNVIRNNIGWVKTPPEAPGYNFIRYFNKDGENTIENNLKETDPLFKDYPDDLSLHENSPAIDAAEPIEDIVIDGITIPPFNDPVIGKMDMGAYEYGAEPFRAGSTLDDGTTEGSTITIHAAGKTGSEAMILSIEGNPVATFNNIGGNFDAEIYEEYTFHANKIVIYDMVSVWIDNYDETKALKIDKITVDGLNVESEKAACTCNINYTELLDCKGGFLYSDKNRFTIDITAKNGTVELVPPGGLYYDGTTITMTAKPDEGFIFGGWEGDLTGSRADKTTTISENLIITANFTQDNTNVNSPGAEDPIEVYPNPVVDNELVIVGLKNTGPASVILSDLNGRILLSEKVHNPEKMKLSGDLSKGVFIIRITSDNSVITKKILIQ